MKSFECLQVKFLASSLLMIGLAASAQGAVSQAGSREPTSVRPRWSNRGTIHNSPNSSLLSTLDPLLNEPKLADELFDSQVSAEMSQRYSDLNRNYDMRKNYDLLSRQEEEKHHSEMSDFSKKAIRAYGGKHMGEQLGKLEKIVQNTPGLAKPVSMVAAAAAIYTGKEVKVKVTQDTRLSSMTDGPGRKATFKLHSPLINGNLDYKAAPDDSQSTDLLSKHETMKVSFTRGLPLWNLQSGVSYGASTSTMTASISKALNPNLTCVVDSAHSSRSDQVTQEAVKIFYGLNF